jgi:hypothetical protein
MPARHERIDAACGTGRDRLLIDAVRGSAGMLRIHDARGCYLNDRYRECLGAAEVEVAPRFACMEDEFA